MSKFSNSVLFSAALCGAMMMCGTSASASITVDGDILDGWGVTIDTHTGVLGAGAGDGLPGPGHWGLDASTVNPSSGNFQGNANFTSTDGVNAGFYYAFADDKLSPDAGGQNYDSEFLGVGYDDDYLYITIVSGMRPNNGADQFALGDIYLTVGGIVYGVETGAGIVGPGGNGATFAINTSGYTVGATYSDGLGTWGIQNSAVQGGTKAIGPHNTAQTAGSIFTTTATDWFIDPIGTLSQFTPTEFKSTGAAFGSSTFSYVTFGAEHSVIELAIEKSLFGSGNKFTTVSWSPVCGNDLINETLTVEIPTNLEGVPEPASLLLMLMGGLGFMGARGLRRRQVAC